MSTTPVSHPARGESLLSVDPELLQQVDAGWRHRLSLYTGRALTDTALSAEQTYRSGRLALLSQLVSPGVGSGLDASIDNGGRVHVQPGYGFASTGEDVTLMRELVVPSWDSLQVVDAVTGVVKQGFADLKKDPAQHGRRLRPRVAAGRRDDQPRPSRLRRGHRRADGVEPGRSGGLRVPGSRAPGRRAARAGRVAEPRAAHAARGCAGQHVPQPARDHHLPGGAGPGSGRHQRQDLLHPALGGDRRGGRPRRVRRVVEPAVLRSQRRGAQRRPRRSSAASRRHAGGGRRVRAGVARRGRGAAAADPRAERAEPVANRSDRVRHAAADRHPAGRRRRFAEQEEQLVSRELDAARRADSRRGGRDRAARADVRRALRSHAACGTKPMCSSR